MFFQCFLGFSLCGFLRKIFSFLKKVAIDQTLFVIFFVNCDVDVFVSPIKSKKLMFSPSEKIVFVLRMVLVSLYCIKTGFVQIFSPVDLYNGKLYKTCCLTKYPWQKFHQYSHLSKKFFIIPVISAMCSQISFLLYKLFKFIFSFNYFLNIFVKANTKSKNEFLSNFNALCLSHYTIKNFWKIYLHQGYLLWMVLKCY